MALQAIKRFQYQRNLLGAFCEVGIELLKRSGDSEVISDALAQLSRAEERIGDPELGTILQQFQTRFAQIQSRPVPDATASAK